ncbi:DUF202 domain-containing protein [Streptomyces sp. V4-01]|uniref:DUF202 domain-containing protein n=1 Tax=Actinacidiphila polyblastidii TaxID=3110430 RepID=A0ABU7PIK1_9ACTN|nr:DUF202 domain-containing protein [Streptomyces sp. V4-01]
MDAAPAGEGGARTGSGRWVAVETDRDPGLQPERTRLAWRRTTLSWAVVAVLGVRQALRRPGGGAALPVTAVCVLAAVFLAFLALAHLRIQRLGRSPQPARLSRRAALAVLTCTLALAACGAALIL